PPRGRPIPGSGARGLAIRAATSHRPLTAAVLDPGSHSGLPIFGRSFPVGAPPSGGELRATSSRIPRVPMHDRLTQSRRLAAWCGLLLYVLTAVAVPLADGWVHGTLGAAAEATHVENPDGKSHEPPSQHQDCTLCRVQSTLS